MIINSTARQEKQRATHKTPGRAKKDEKERDNNFLCTSYNLFV